VKAFAIHKHNFLTKNKKMSLDVYLITKEPQIKKASSGIFVRENGQTKEITQDEWNAKYPDREPVKFEQEATETNEVFSANITHNLCRMAHEAGIYEALWRPHRLKECYNIPENDHEAEWKFEEENSSKAKELIEPLRQGLHSLKIEPEKYEKFNPKNAWGSYHGLVTFVEKYLNACYEYPDADVKVSR
jgi:hypothetical protein